MPPKHKPAISSPLVASPATPSNAQLSEERSILIANGTVTVMDSSPLARKATAPPNNSADETALLPSTPDTVDAGIVSKQGVAEGPKKAPGRKRKVATEEADAEPPVAKRKKATPPKPKKAAAPRKTQKTPKIVIDAAEGKDSVHADVEETPLLPLTRAVEAKLKAVDAFLDSHTSPLITREEGSANIAMVDELDLLAALIILQTDYQLAIPTEATSLEGAGDMLVSRDIAGRARVDFDRSCDIERAVQRKLAGRQTGMEEVNLVEVEIEILLARREQLVKDGEPAAGFRVYDREPVNGEATVVT